MRTNTLNHPSNPHKFRRRQQILAVGESREVIMRAIKQIIVHCSDSHFGDAATIRDWHTLPKPRGNGWQDIGRPSGLRSGPVKARLHPGRVASISRPIRRKALLICSAKNGMFTRASMFDWPLQ